MHSKSFLCELTLQASVLQSGRPAQNMFLLMLFPYCTSLVHSVLEISFTSACFRYWEKRHDSADNRSVRRENQWNARDSGVMVRVSHRISLSHILRCCMWILEEAECEVEEDTRCERTMTALHSLRFCFWSSTVLKCKHTFESCTQLPRSRTQTNNTCAYLCRCCSLTHCTSGGRSVFPQWNSAPCQHPSHWWPSSPGTRTDVRRWFPHWTKKDTV